MIGVQVNSQTNANQSRQSPATANQAAMGAPLANVDAGGPAAKAGLKAGDVVIRVNTQRIDDADSLIAAIRSHAPGETVSLSYMRGSQAKTVQVTLGSSTR